MLLETSFGGGQPGPWCCACKQPIAPGQRSTRIEFENDPNGFKGLSGHYHVECSKPFVSMARVLTALKPPRT